MGSLAERIQEVSDDRHAVQSTLPVNLRLGHSHRHYSWLQALPYVFGFLIVGGFLAFAAGLSGTGPEDKRAMEMATLVFTGAFAALIFVNYVLQTAFIPQALDSDPGLLAALTMTNPRSLAWGLELYGYGLLGVATAFAARLFGEDGRQGTIRLLLYLNCIVSVATAAPVPIVPGWVLTLPGMIAGASWNLLIVVIMILVMREFRFGRQRQGVPP